MNVYMTRVRSRKNVYTMMKVTYTIPLAIRYDGFVILCWLSIAY